MLYYSKKYKNTFYPVQTTAYISIPRQVYGKGQFIAQIRGLSKNGDYYERKSINHIRIQ